MTKVKTKSITFAVDYTTAGGRTYKADSTHTINSPEARVLLRLGKARLADSEPAAVDNGDQVTGTPAADTAGDGETSAAADTDGDAETEEPAKTTARKGK